MKNNLLDAGYTLNEESNIWTKPGYAGIAYSDGDEVEQRIARIVKETDDISVLSLELRQHCTDWPSLYHLTSTRANILRPFEADLCGADVLEIGAGCGAITRYLGECGAHVLALEGSPRRAAIARSRTRDLPNVTLVSDKFDQFQTHHRFDLITLIGVLEYANLFENGVAPALTMLRRAKALLKPNGKLVIAIENQLGLKYFAGAPEDHIGQPMYGIEGRYRKDQPQTYGRRVLQQMLGDAGYSGVEFMAPFPDYKLPVSVITEAGFNTDGFDAATLASQSVRADPQLPEKLAFSPELVWPIIGKNHLGIDLANSFIVVAGNCKKPDAQKEILAWHFATGRKKEFCKEIRFIKTNAENIDVHSKKLIPGSFTNDANALLQLNLQEHAPYIIGTLLQEDLTRIFVCDNWEQNGLKSFLERYLKIVADYVARNSGETIVLDCPDARLSGKYFDCVPQNIIVSPNGEHVIDQEWLLSVDINAAFLVFRSLSIYSKRLTKLGQPGEGFEKTILGGIQCAYNSLGWNVSEEEIYEHIQLECKIQNEAHGRQIKPEDFLAGLKQQATHLTFWEAMADRDAQIAHLAQSVAERDARIANLEADPNERDRQIAHLTQTVAERDGQITELLQSTSWCITAPYRILGHQVKRIRRIWRLLPMALRQGGGVKTATAKAYRIYRKEGLEGIKRRLIGIQTVATNAPVSLTNGQQVDRNDYQEWVRRYDTIDDMMRTRIQGRIGEMKALPLISVVMPTYNPKPQWLREAIESVQKQLYPNWELCIADDASTDPAIRPLLECFAAEDPRIKIVFREKNGHISAASNSALELATGDWVALLDHDDLLSEDALFWVAQTALTRADVQMIYSDEDKIDEKGLRHSPYFKSDWNPDLFYSHNMFCHLGVYRHDLVRSVGGFQLGLEGAQDYDLALRCIERIKPDQIAHIPRVLYHWRVHPQSTAANADAKPYAMLAGEQALNGHFRRMGIKGRVELVGFGYRAHYELPTPAPLVSLLIPTRDRKAITEVAVRSILEKTTYPNYEIVILDNGSVESETLEWFKDIQRDNERVRVIRYDYPFNYSAINNFGVTQAKGSIIGLINNDIEVIAPDWLSEMVSHAVREDIGCVGAKLHYGNDTLQHGGVVLGLRGVAGHSHKHFPQGSTGYAARLMLASNFSAVTAACLLVRKKIFEAVGGLDEENLQVAFNDVDFCIKVHEAGYRNLWTPYAELYHHESISRGAEDTPEKQARFQREVQYMKNKWGQKLTNDPCYSPNLTLDFEDFSLAWPPRVKAIEVENESNGFSEKAYLALYPDVASAVQAGGFKSGWEHYQKCGKREGRQLSGITNRERAVFHLIDKMGIGLEIGPSHNPIAPKRKGYNVHIVDHASAEDLRVKYQGHGLNLDNIEEVDFVSKG